MSRNSAARRRRKTPTEESAAKRLKPVDLAQHSDVIDSDDDSSSSSDEKASFSSFEEEEDLATRKVRLAKEYLQRLERQPEEDASSSSSGDDDDDESDASDRLGRRLQRQRLKQQGTWQRNVADKVEARISKLSHTVLTNVHTTTTSQTAWGDARHVQLLRGHDLTPTAVALYQDGTRALSGAKDHSVLLWDVERGQKLATLCPHWRHRHQTTNHHHRTAGQVLAVAAAEPYVAVGSRDGLVRIFDVRANHHQQQHLVQEFRGHKGAVTDLCFRPHSLQLFSASEDRCIRHYNLQEMMYMETLYGHQFAVTAMDCPVKERPVSVGRDRTARAWKLAQDTHLIFRGGSRIQNAESISMIKDDWFITGHEDGNLSLWFSEKKKAVAVQPAAHGTTSNGLGRGVVSVRALYGSDVCATGSCDGYLRLWKVKTGSTTAERGLTPLSAQIPLDGYLNSIAWGPKARFAVVAQGQEHRLGRWNPVKGAKNRLAIVKLYSEDIIGNQDDDDEEEEKNEEAPSESDGDESSSSGDEPS